MDSYNRIAPDVALGKAIGNDDEIYALAQIAPQQPGSRLHGITHPVADNGLAQRLWLLPSKGRHTRIVAAAFGRRGDEDEACHTAEVFWQRVGMGHGSTFWIGWVHESLRIHEDLRGPSRVWRGPLAAWPLDQALESCAGTNAMPESCKSIISTTDRPTVLKSHTKLVRDSPKARKISIAATYSA